MSVEDQPQNPPASEEPPKRALTSLTQLVRNALYNSGTWVVNIGLLLLVTPYFVYKLGADGYGVYSLLVGLVGYYSLADLGLAQSITKYVAQYEAEGNHEATFHSINAALLVQLGIGSVISGAIVFFADPIIGLLNVSESFHASTKTGIYICAGSFFLQMIGSTFSSVLQGLQRYDVSSKLVVITESAKNLGIAAALYSGAGLVGAVSVAGAAAGLFFVMNFVLLRQHLSEWSPSYGVTRKTFRELFSFSGFLFISRLANLFQNHIVRFVISFFLGPAAVTLYVVPLKVVKAGEGILSRASSTLLPYASELDGGRADRKALRQTLVVGTKSIMTVAVPLFLLVVVFSQPLMTVWMGAEFAKETWPFLSLLAADKILASFSMVPILMALGMGYARLRAQFSIAEVILYATLLPILTDAYGLMGTVGAVILSAFPSLIFIGYVARRILDFPLSTFLRATLAFHIPSIIITVVFVALDGVQYIPNTLSGLLIALPIGLLYLGIMYIFGWIPDVKRLRQKLRPAS